MNINVVKQISNSLNIKEQSVVATLNLLSEGATIPFISRYRKEVTGNLDEEEIRKISEVYNYGVNLEKRKEDVIRLIEEKDLMTDELKNKILSCEKLVDVEDIYRPFKEKKKTKATEAIANKLEPLAKIIMSFNNTNIEEEAKKYLNENVATTKDALQGAKYIIAEWISDNATYRKYIRNLTFNTGEIETKLKKNAVDEKEVYKIYYDYKERIKFIKPHRYLAINRAINEKIVSMKLIIDIDKIFEFLERNIVKNKKSASYEIVMDAIADSYKRLIAPSIEREIMNELFEISEDKAINVFASNLEMLLMQQPIKEQVILGLDPAFRTGCKLAVLDKNGSVLNISVIYPNEPRNDVENSEKHVLELINKFNVNIIAIGNGTASRESEQFIVNVIKKSNKDVNYVIVNEAGASVYSASKLAIEEFPKLHVEERSAISIGRRLLDPLSELVKIDSKSIGVGQYQHDVNGKKLDESLDFTVSKIVNRVGVNINTASTSILKYVSGLNKKNIENIIEYRNTVNKITTRAEIKKIKSVSDKVFEQAIGFLRIVDGDNILDKTSIHPESYDITYKLLTLLNLDLNNLESDTFKDVLKTANIDELIIKLDSDKFTLDLIIKSLLEPNRDPRNESFAPILKSDILKITDLNIGMKLKGTVRNLVDFGVFVDIGLKNDGMVHISKITKEFIKHPSDVLAVGDIVEVSVFEIFEDKNKVSLTMI